tara:strand:- start:1310 stop:2380 length:1071 start_codon:yes stop_codon:yes gene_type:complete
MHLLWQFVVVGVLRDTCNSTIDDSNIRDAVAFFKLNHLYYEQYCEIQNWDTSRVTDMSHLFATPACRPDWDTFGVALQIQDWDVRNVESTNGMFDNCQLAPNLSKWKFEKLRTMDSMFAYAKEFNSDISSWNVSTVEDMDSAFFVTEKFNQDLSSWVVNKVTTANFLFRGASSFNQNLSAWNIGANVNTYDIFLDSNMSCENLISTDNGWPANIGLGDCSSAPTTSPTLNPTGSPTTATPTGSPTTATPTASPTTATPTFSPTLSPSFSPSLSPTTILEDIAFQEKQDTNAIVEVTATFFGCLFILIFLVMAVGLIYRGGFKKTDLHLRYTDVKETLLGKQKKTDGDTKKVKNIVF